MRKILPITTIIALFLVAGLIFWIGLSPKTFYKFLLTYPVQNRSDIQTGVMDEQVNKISNIILSEPVLSTSGQIIINKNIWDVQIVKAEEDLAKGLSERKLLYNKNGMLFIFDNSELHYFWMKDMLIPIDMIFFDEEWKIVLIESNVQIASFPKNFGGSVKSKYVLEINALEANIYDLRVGDQAIFLNK